MQRLDYDFRRLRMRPRNVKSSAVRGKSYDWWVQRFLDDCPQCTVLHLGCGLDTRIYRVNPPSTVCWYDIDLPDVIASRQRLFPGRPRRPGQCQEDQCARAESEPGGSGRAYG